MEITPTGTGRRYPILGQGQTLTPRRKGCGGRRDQKKFVSGWINDVHTSAGGYRRRRRRQGGGGGAAIKSSQDSQKKKTHVVSIHFWVPFESFFFFFVNGHISSPARHPSHPPSLVKSNDIMCIYIYLYVQYKTRLVTECTVERLRAAPSTQQLATADPPRAGCEQRPNQPVC